RNRASPARIRAGSPPFDRPRSRVEFLDHPVPHRNDLADVGPELRALAGPELLDGDALLLHPREVAEVEDPGPVLIRELPQVVGALPQEVLPEHLPRRDRVELPGEVLPDRLVAFRS